ncbi:acetyltransferase (plasmid) [Ensifer adhaerens]|nr:acetyltransferase [Ensifer adhaerens]UTV39271.1 acetyltransferase [Ensifer adhaerens]
MKSQSTPKVKGILQQHALNTMSSNVGVNDHDRWHGKDDVIGIFGSGGCGKEVLPLALDPSSYVESLEGRRGRTVCFVAKDSADVISANTPRLTEEAFFALHGERHFILAIADSRIRERIAEKCSAFGVLPLSLQAPNATVHMNVEVGAGTIICGYSTIGPDTRIGRFCQANVYTYIAHDCVIGDFVTFGPRACCNGNVHIHDHAYIGAGALLRQGSNQRPLTIGEGAVIGMGAVVTRDVPPFTTVVGNPARPLRVGI